MIYSNDFSIYFTLSLIGGSLFGMDTYSSTGKTSESRSGSKLSALNFARAQYELLRKHPDTKQEAREKFRATISDIYGLTSSNKTIRPTSSNNDSIVVRYLPDGTAVIDCSRLKLKENPRFKAQEEFFARINAMKAHNDWLHEHRPMPAADDSAANQLKESKRIAEDSKAPLIERLKALSDIDAAKSQLRHFTVDGSLEYQRHSKSASVAFDKTAHPDSASPSDPDLSDSDYLETHPLKNEIRDFERAFDQIKSIHALHESLPNNDPQAWLEVCVQLQSIEPLNVTIDGQHCNPPFRCTVKEFLGKTMLSVMRGMHYPNAKKYKEEQNADFSEIEAHFSDIKQQFSAATSWLGKSLAAERNVQAQSSHADDRKVDKSKFNDSQRDDYEVNRFKRVMPKIDTKVVLKAVKDFNQNPSEAHKKELIRHLPEPNNLISSDRSLYFLDVIKMHLNNNDLAKAQHYCEKYLALVEKDQA